MEIKLSKGFFIYLVACLGRFLIVYHPYSFLDARHLKGKFNGVLIGKSAQGH